MKAKILGLVLLLSLSTALMAQTPEKGVKGQRPGRAAGAGMMMHQKGQMGPAAGMNFTDAQKEAFKVSMMAMHKKMLPLKNELGEAEAHQKTLVTAEKPDFGAINKNLEKIGAIHVEMAKMETKHRLEMRAQLTDEQRLRFDMMKGQMGREKGMKGSKGPKDQRGMKGKMPMHRQGAMN